VPWTGVDPTRCYPLSAEGVRERSLASRAFAPVPRKGRVAPPAPDAWYGIFTQRRTVNIEEALGLPHASTSGDAVTAPEELVVVRAAHWRMLVPLCQVRRVHPAVMPTARPGAPALSPVVSVEGALLPVAFAASLAGGTRVELEGHHQMVELVAGGLRGLLWVDAVEDVVPSEPAPGDPSPEALVARWSCGGRPLPVLDVPRLLELLR